MGKQRSAHGGYTLIEILIVMLIISIVGVASLLTISANKNSRLETYAKQLTNLITLAQQQAMLEPAVLGLMIQNETLTFYEYQQAIDAKHKSTWVPLTDTVLKPHRIPKEIKLQLKIAEQSVSTQTPEPQLVISSSGDVTPFHIYVGEKNKSPLYQVMGQEDGSISSGKISHEK